MVILLRLSTEVQAIVSFSLFYVSGLESGGRLVLGIVKGYNPYKILVRTAKGQEMLVIDHFI